MANRTQRKTPQTPAGPPLLMVPADQLREEISERLTCGQELIDGATGDEDALKERRQEYYTWTEYNKALLRRSFDITDPADEYAREPGFAVFGGAPDPLPVRWKHLHDDIEGKLRRLRSLQERLPLFRYHPETAQAVPAAKTPSGTEVFIVHGHDGEAKIAVARFLSRLLAREPIILHEHADRGRTIIEKFEDHAGQVGSAVVLLTGDDEGGAVGGPQQRRARQNVVFELGFFLAKLGRERVVILYEEGVELPSDIQGVLYVALDSQGVWRNKLAGELRAAGLEVDLTALIR
ncbi:nucleotide-binding protein [Nonomuraea sp. NN258]|uniref:TIR domain-containing protein n=1 Tax=Nonomuraea antri TaxID=2730852 RepID=UPI001569C39E|nr:nucleotide-binding protein [Nonomuraea antri]NRQ36299.1 nucleotide-binding protein [Nonomuraea antri]